MDPGGDQLAKEGDIRPPFEQFSSDPEVIIGVIEKCFLQREIKNSLGSMVPTGLPSNRVRCKEGSISL